MYNTKKRNQFIKIIKGIPKMLHYLNNRYLYAVAALMTMPCIAEASEAGSQLKEGVSKVAGIMMIFAFLFALGIAIAGGVKLSKGEKETGKTMLIGAGLIAGSVAIVTVIFYAFGVGEATTSASFDI